MPLRGLVTIGLPWRKIFFTEGLWRSHFWFWARTPHPLYLLVLLYCKRSLLICDCSLRPLSLPLGIFISRALFALVVFFCFPALFPLVVLWPPLQGKESNVSQNLRQTHTSFLINIYAKGKNSPTQGENSHILFTFFPSLPPSLPCSPPALSLSTYWIFLSLFLCHLSLSSLSLTHKRNTPAGGIPDQEPQRQGNSQATPQLSVLWKEKSTKFSFSTDVKNQRRGHWQANPQSFSLSLSLSQTHAHTHTHTHTHTHKITTTFLKSYHSGGSQI